MLKNNENKTFEFLQFNRDGLLDRCNPPLTEVRNSFFAEIKETCIFGL